jgi:hypothetical protein
LLPIASRSIVRAVPAGRLGIPKPSMTSRP